MKNNLDERQEQVLLQIEHRACWFTFWALLVVLAIEAIIFRMDIKSTAGEWGVFMCLSVYLYYECMRNKIWGRHLKPDGKTNLIVSVIASLLFGAIMFIGVWMNYPAKPVGALAAGVITAAFVFIPCFFVLTISAKKLRKDLQKEEEEPEE